MLKCQHFALKDSLYSFCRLDINLLLEAALLFSIDSNLCKVKNSVPYSLDHDGWLASKVK